MVDQLQRVKLTDLGISKSLEDDQSEKQRRVVGTPHYMAPGCTGRRSRCAQRHTRLALRYFISSLAGHIAKVKWQKFYNNTRLRPHCQPPRCYTRFTETLTQLIMELMAKSPNDRPNNAEEVADRLQVIEQEIISNSVMTVLAENRLFFVAMPAATTPTPNSNPPATSAAPHKHPLARHPWPALPEHRSPENGGSRVILLAILLSCYFSPDVAMGISFP